MLHRRAHAGNEQRDQNRPETLNVTQGDECTTRHQRAKCEQVALAELLRDEPGRDLEGRHGSAVRGADEADLRQVEIECLREHLVVSKDDMAYLSFATDAEQAVALSRKATVE